MVKLSLLVLLDGEANDIDEWELEVLGETWAYVTILLSEYTSPSAFCLYADRDIFTFFPVTRNLFPTPFDSFVTRTLSLAYGLPP